MLKSKVMKHRASTIFLLFITIVFCSDLHSQELSEDEVVSTALNSHPGIFATKQKVEAAQGEYRSAEGGFDPVIRMNSLDFLAGNYNNAGYFDTWLEQATSLYGVKVIAGYRKSSGKLPDYYDQEITQDNGEVRVGVELPLLRDGEIDARRANISRAKIQSDIAQTDVEYQEIEIARLAKEAFYDWVAAGRRHDVVNQLYLATLKRQAQLEERQANGDIAQFDVVDNRKSVLQRQAAVLEVKRQLAKAQFELSLFARDPDTKEPVIVDSARMPKELPAYNNRPLRSIESYISEAYERRPDLKKIAQLKNQNSIDQTLASNQTLPRLDAQFLTSQDLGEKKDSYNDTDYRLGLKFEYPFFNNAAEGKIDALSAKLRELEYLQILLKDKIRADIQDALAAIEAATSRIEISTKEYEAAKDVQKGELDKFYHGDSNLIFVNLREQSTADSALRLIDAKLDLLKAHTALEAITAKRSFKEHDDVKSK